MDGIPPKGESIFDYPITKKLFLHTSGKPREEIQKFLRWILQSDQAAEIAKGVGFTLPPSD